MKHMITSTEAHITIPPFFCVLSAYKAQHNANNVAKKWEGGKTQTKSLEHE